METTFIYILSDPRNGEPKYVGKSNVVRKRYRAHLGTDKRISRRRCWILSLIKLGLKPELSIIDEVKTSEWQFWECHYISLYRSWGFDLTNMTDGGDGVTTHSDEIRKKISDKTKGRKLTPEHIAKREAGKIRNGTHKRSEECRKRNSATRLKNGITIRVTRWSLDFEEMIMFPSMASALRLMKLPMGSNGNIKKAIDGEYDMAYGYYWMLTKEDLCEFIERKSQPKPKKIVKQGSIDKVIVTKIARGLTTKITRINMNDDLDVIDFDSLSQASRSVGKKDDMGIIRACKNHHRGAKAYGFYWRFA